MKMVPSAFKRREFLIGSATSALALKFGGIFKHMGQFLAPDAVKAAGGQAVGVRRPLKAIVVYYSASGNTGRIAGAIYKGMKSVIQCDIAPIEKMDPKDLAKYDVIAIGGPVWHFRESANLKLYLYRMPQLPDKLCVLFCTHGSNPKAMFYDFEKGLRKRQATVIGWNDWYGKSELSLHSPKPAPTDGHPDAIDLKEAEDFGREMGDRAQRIRAGERNLIPVIPTGPDADKLWISPVSSSGGGAVVATAGLSAVSAAGVATLPSRAGGGPGNGPALGTSSTAHPGGPARPAAGAGGGPGNSPALGTSSTAHPGGPARPSPGPAGQGGGPGVNHAPPGGPVSVAAASTHAAAGPAAGMAPSPGGPGGAGGSGASASATAKSDPVIDLGKCVYPRCTACIDNCAGNAIDLSMIASAALVSDSSMLVKGCLHCAPAPCIRSCAYDAITYPQEQQIHVIDMKKCTYPKCTLCVDHCPMHVIDFSFNPPVFHKACEGCDVCYALCPTRALTITNMAETHGAMSQPCDPKHPTANCHGIAIINGKLGYQGFYSPLNEAEEKGKFRPLVPIEQVGWNTELSTFTRVPLFARNENDWPYHIS